MGCGMRTCLVWYPQSKASTAQVNTTFCNVPYYEEPLQVGKYKSERTIIVWEEMNCDKHFHKFKTWHTTKTESFSI